MADFGMPSLMTPIDLPVLNIPAPHAGTESKVQQAAYLHRRKRVFRQRRYCGVHVENKRAAKLLLDTVFERHVPPLRLMQRRDNPALPVQRPADRRPLKAITSWPWATSRFISLRLRNPSASPTGVGRRAVWKEERRLDPPRQLRTSCRRCPAPHKLAHEFLT